LGRFGLIGTPREVTLPEMPSVCLRPFYNKKPPSPINLPLAKKVTKKQQEKKHLIHLHVAFALSFRQVFWLRLQRLVFLPKDHLSGFPNKTLPLQRRDRAGLTPASLFTKKSNISALSDT
jgi:hypothetical protein